MKKLAVKEKWQSANPSIAVIEASQAAFCAATVLLVEDDASAAELMRIELARNGVATVVACRLSEAPALLEKRSFSAILLDYQSPDGDPWAVVKSASIASPAIPVIPVSGKGRDAIAPEMNLRGADPEGKTGPFWEQIPAIIDRVAKIAASREDQAAGNAQSELLATMSHEIRTPLNAVIGFGYLLEKTALSEDQRRFIKYIQCAGATLLTVVNDVLDLAKIEAGAMALENEAINIQELLLSVSQMLLPQATDKGIKLVVIPPVELPWAVKGDESRLRQILNNLVSNAIKFTEVGHVVVKIVWAGEAFGRIAMHCDVSDTGIGIRPEAFERLFKPYSQADASISRKFGGTGLGLSISRRLVRLMGGEMGVSSEVAVGSTFWFEVPLELQARA